MEPRAALQATAFQFLGVENNIKIFGLKKVTSAAQMSIGAMQGFCVRTFSAFCIHLADSMSIAPGINVSVLEDDRPRPESFPTIRNA